MLFVSLKKSLVSDPFGSSCSLRMWKTRQEGTTFFDSLDGHQMRKSSRSVAKRDAPLKRTKEATSSEHFGWRVQLLVLLFPQSNALAYWSATEIRLLLTPPLWSCSNRQSVEIFLPLLAICGIQKWSPTCLFVSVSPFVTANVLWPADNHISALALKGTSLGCQQQGLVIRLRRLTRYFF